MTQKWKALRSSFTRILLGLQMSFDIDTWNKHHRMTLCMCSCHRMLRHNAGFYVKHVQTGMGAMLELHGLRADNSNGCSINLRRHGIKSGWLDLFCPCFHMFIYFRFGRFVSCRPRQKITWCCKVGSRSDPCRMGRGTAKGCCLDRWPTFKIRRKRNTSCPKELHLWSTISGNSSKTGNHFLDCHGSESCSSQQSRFKAEKKTSARSAAASK